MVKDGYIPGVEETEQLTAHSSQLTAGPRPSHTGRKTSRGIFVSMPPPHAAIKREAAPAATQPVLKRTQRPGQV